MVSGPSKGPEHSPPVFTLRSAAKALYQGTTSVVPKP